MTRKSLKNISSLEKGDSSKGQSFDQKEKSISNITIPNQKLIEENENLTLAYREMEYKHTTLAEEFHKLQLENNQLEETFKERERDLANDYGELLDSFHDLKTNYIHVDKQNEELKDRIKVLESQSGSQQDNRVIQSGLKLRLSSQMIEDLRIYAKKILPEWIAQKKPRKKAFFMKIADKFEIGYGTTFNYCRDIYEEKFPKTVKENMREFAKEILPEWIAQKKPREKSQERSRKRAFFMKIADKFGIGYITSLSYCRDIYEKEFPKTIKEKK